MQTEHDGSMLRTRKVKLLMCISYIYYKETWLAVLTNKISSDISNIMV